MTKKDANPAEKKSFLQQDLDLKVLFANLGKKKVKKDGGEVLPDNSADNFEPTLPEVNLLPGNIKETYAAEDLGKKFIKGGIAAALGFGLLFGVSFVTDTINQGKIDDIKAQTSANQTEISSLNAYTGYREAVSAKRTEVASLTNGSIDVGAVNEQFKNSVESAGYDINSVSLSVSGGGDAAVAGSCVNPDPFTPATGVGCVTFSLSDTGDSSMTELFAAVGKQDSGFINMYIPSALQNEEGATIDGSVSITEKFQVPADEKLALPMDQVIDEMETADGEGE